MNVIQIENLWKQYRLGVIGHGTLTKDLQSWWARIRGKEDPNTKINTLLNNDDNRIDGDRFWALRDINLEVKQGEVLGVIGKNGSGKSTLLKILSRVTAPTKGNIEIKGRIASLLEVGTGFHPELTGRENVFLNGAILGMSKNEVKNKFDEIISFSGIEDFIDTPVKRYSSGMYVRLAFAVAAHLEPEILVVDEVLAVGDAEFQSKCLDKMNDVTQKGRTVIFVSHNMAAIKTLCSRAIVLDQGVNKFNGPREDAIDYYLNKNKVLTTYNTDGEIELGAPEKREGSGNIRINKISFYSGDKRENNCLVSAQDAKICLEYVSVYKKKIDMVMVGIYISNIDGSGIFACTTPMTKSNFTNIDNKGVLECIIKNIPLIPGRYGILVNIKDSQGFADKIEMKSCFEVSDKGLTGLTNFPSQLASPIFVECSWLWSSGLN